MTLADAGGRASERTLLEVQALRALAVGLVVAYHLWPSRLPGGFVGVDVFFVISGFLITAHLLREQEDKGRIHLLRFWSRRIRRLLPAALVVLAVCAIASFTVLPEVVRLQTLRQIAAASIYCLNWVLGIDAVDYLAAGNQATVVQHYWTLSVEEQFYVLWPLLLMVTIAVGARLVRRRTTVSPAALFAISAGIIVVASLGYSIYLTWVSPAFAYFSTFTRGWEFAAGGLLAAVFALLPRAVSAVRESRAGRLGLPLLLGAAVILGASIVLSGSSPFPGFLAALPVTGTLLVIVGGMPQPRILAAVIGARPVQFIGDVSYSLYLWHWPLITGVVLLAGRHPTWYEGLVIAGASILLAAATKRWIEDPVRFARPLSRTPIPALALALTGALLFIGLFGGSSAYASWKADHDRETITEAVDDPSGCFGANAMLGTSDCPDRFTLDESVDLAAAGTDLNTADWCLTWYDIDWASCEFGDPTGRAGTLAVVGDSHAASLIAAFDEYFADAGWKVVSFTRFGCPALNVGIVAQDDATDTGRKEYACRVWTERVHQELIARSDITSVVFLNFTSGYMARDSYALTTGDIVSRWQALVDAGKTVYSVRDWPSTDGDPVPVCLAAHVGETGPCSTERVVSAGADPESDALAAMAGAVTGIDLTDAFCDESRCYSVIGDVVVYADNNHISGTYGRTLMRYLGPLLE